jgi:hypothetical protein
MASALPPICAVTGGDATGTFLLRAPSVWRGILTGGFAYRFPGGSFVEVPVSTAVTEYIAADRQSGRLLVLAGFVSAVLVGLAPLQPILFVAGFIGLLMVLVLALRVRQQARSPGRLPTARRIRGDVIRIRGVHAAFASALRQRKLP